MIGYAYIEQLFSNILKESAGIQGRLLVCPQMGIEINADDLYKVITDDLTINPAKKYPIALLMPPPSFGIVGSNEEPMQITMFFLKQIGRVGVRQIDQPNIATRTSTHSITEDWHDMKRCAQAFIILLEKLIRAKRLFTESLFFDKTKSYRITPISNIGADVLAGVRLDFSIVLKQDNCLSSDYLKSEYAENAIETIVLPPLDPHPIHSL